MMNNSDCKLTCKVVVSAIEIYNEAVQAEILSITCRVQNSVVWWNSKCPEDPKFQEFFEV